MLTDRYYSNEHDWIEFNGRVAYIGFSKYKLTAIENFESVEFINDSSHVEKGEQICNVYSAEYKISLNIPFACKIIECNDKLIGSPEKLKEAGEGSTWLIKVAPIAPYSREGLMMTDEYFEKVNSSTNKI